MAERTIEDLEKENKELQELCSRRLDSNIALVNQNLKLFDKIKDLKKALDVYSESCDSTVFGDPEKCPWDDQLCCYAARTALGRLREDEVS